MYFCENCQEEFEATHSISVELEECTECKLKGSDSKKPKRLIAGTSFILKGGGWAKEGYS